MLCFRLFVLLAALTFALPVAAQDCTLATTAECNGVPCPGETRPEGRIVYNTDYDVAQICQDGIWVALGPIGDFCPGSGLVGHWKLDESGNVSTAADSAGSNDGTLTNFPADPSANWVSGKLGNALDFDGSDDHVAVSDPADGSLDPSYVTVSAWVRSADTTHVNGHQFIVSKASDCCSNTGGYSLAITNQAEIRGDIWHTAAQLSIETGTLNSNQWYHLVMTFDGANIRLYLDGAQVAVSSTVSDTIKPSALDLVIGSMASNPSFYRTEGQIDDVRIYNVALPQSDIDALYNGGAGCQ